MYHIAMHTVRDNTSLLLPLIEKEVPRAVALEISVVRQWTGAVAGALEEAVAENLSLFVGCDSRC